MNIAPASRNLANFIKQMDLTKHLSSMQIHCQLAASGERERQRWLDAMDEVFAMIQ